MYFAERYGFGEMKPLQSTSIDDDLRHSLWNQLEGTFYCSIKDDKYCFIEILKVFWSVFFKRPLYLLEDNISELTEIGILRDKYYKLPWYKIYSFLEFTVAVFGEQPIIKKLIEACNYVLERENSAYRFIGNLIVPITLETEIKSIEESLMDEDEAAKHINSALFMLENKQNDQSHESIIQSILAVEAIAKKITGDKNATLASLFQKTKILSSNSQAKQALLNLYTYTSSKEGIRHPLTNESQPVTPAWARFMLVVSSAFVNLIKLDIKSNKSV
ncbi:MAG: hypothetical protein WAW84_06140 [Candidatus Rickettsiella isopodorum]